MTEVMVPQLIEAIEMLASCLKNGNKVLLLGNGGSAADAQHMAGELVGRFEKEIKPIPFISLTTDSSVLTSIGNDYGFKEIFSRQIDALVSRGDVVICFSTSGESENVIEGVIKAREKGAVVIGFLGQGKKPLTGLVDLPLQVPSSRTCRIQEGHITLVHLICESLGNLYSGK
jgi:D-sedoheptulose 7-phosphate isomerase